MVWEKCHPTQLVRTIKQLGVHITRRLNYLEVVKNNCSTLLQCILDKHMFQYTYMLHDFNTNSNTSQLAWYWSTFGNARSNEVFSWSSGCSNDSCTRWLSLIWLPLQWFVMSWLRILINTDDSKQEYVWCLSINLHFNSCFQVNLG